jgi:hypothetical protein
LVFFCNFPDSWERALTDPDVLGVAIARSIGSEYLPLCRTCRRRSRRRVNCRDQVKTLTPPADEQAHDDEDDAPQHLALDQ